MLYDVYEIAIIGCASEFERITICLVVIIVSLLIRYYWKLPKNGNLLFRM